jgi:hypothetical protein
MGIGVPDLLGGVASKSMSIGCVVSRSLLVGVLSFSSGRPDYISSGLAPVLAHLLAGENEGEPASFGYVSASNPTKFDKLEANPGQLYRTWSTEFM